MAEMLSSYKLLGSFQNQDAGFSRWTKAASRGRQYFLKEFMNPKYPDQESLKESLRKTRIKECEAFEIEKRNLYSAINKASDGNLVRIADFFRGDSHYYMSTEWVESCDLTFEEISRMGLKEKLILCRTAAHSIAALHSAGIAHSDIKNTNVIVHKSIGGKLVAKIIDYDCSFFENSPPDNEDDLGGDQVYLSPEACMFFCGEDVKLSCKMDVFALGLLFHQYWTGELPYFDKNEYEYAHEAVLDDVVLKSDSADIPNVVGNIIDRMLLKNADQRISAREVYDALTEFYNQRFSSVTGGTRFGSDPSTDESDHRSKSSRLKMSDDFFKPAGDL